MTPAQIFVADLLKNVNDKNLLAMPSVEGSSGTIILMNDANTGSQYWFTSEQRDFELARRAANAGCLFYPGVRCVRQNPRQIARILDGRLMKFINAWRWDMMRGHSNCAERTEQIIRGILDRRYERYRVSSTSAAEAG